MAYVMPNFATKKALRDAIKSEQVVTVFSPGPFPLTISDKGTVFIEGPHYPRPHSWYAEVKVVNGRVVSVK